MQFFMALVRIKKKEYFSSATTALITSYIFAFDIDISIFSISAKQKSVIISRI